MGELRKVPLLIALGLAVAAVLVELGSPLIMGAGEAVPGRGSPVPGRGIPYLALIDGVLAYTIVLATLPLIVPERLEGKLQGVVTLVGSIVLLIAAIALTLLAVAALLLM